MEAMTKNLWEEGREFAKELLGGAPRHAIGQVGIPTSKDSPPWVTLCAGIPTPAQGVETAEAHIFVTCPRCAQLLLQAGYGTKFDAGDPRLKVALERAIALGDHVENAHESGKR